MVRIVCYVCRINFTLRGVLALYRRLVAGNVYGAESVSLASITTEQNNLNK